MLAALYNRPAVLGVLAGAGAELDAASLATGATALIWAARSRGDRGVGRAAQC